MKAEPFPDVEPDLADELGSYAPEPEQRAAIKSTPEPWEEPSPFYETDLPEFPVQALPVVISEYIRALATATQTPVDLAGMLALSVLSASCAKKVRVQIREGFVEPVNVYTVTAIASANRKSAVYKAMLEPQEAFEASESKRLGPEIAKHTTRYKILEKSLQKAQESAAKTSDPEKRELLIRDAESLAAEFATMSILVFPRLLADDCSPERLATLLQDHGGRMALMSAEGDLFEIMAGRYSPNASPNLGVFLKGHSGDELRVDRVGRGPEFVKDPAITIGLTVQPEVIEGLASKPGFRGKGLLARFLYSMPQSPLGNRKANPPPVPEEFTRQYSTTITRLLELPSRGDTDGNAAPHVLHLEDSARNTLIIFMGLLEPKLAPLGELGFISDWAGKLTGTIARISGLIHMAQNAETRDPWDLHITDETINQAILIGEYLIPHARAAFGAMGADPAIEAAKHILAWIKKRELKEFSKRDAFNGCRGRFKRATELDEPLTLLAEQGYIRERAAGSDTGPGRKPSQTYEVNPNCA